MPAKVVDASVMAAWCFREPRAHEALEIIKSCELFAPFLLALELTSIARKKVIAYPDKTTVLSEALRLAITLPIQWCEVDHLAVLHLALEKNITTYDACYLYVSRDLGIPLVTFDEHLAKSAM
jgi:predicted nucleic acid-binding protein